MLIIPPVQYRKRRGRVKRAIAALPVAPLVLVESDFRQGDPSVVLTFDRAIDITRIDVSQVTVDDGVYNMQLLNGAGTGPLQIGPTEVLVSLLPLGRNSQDDVLLTATGTTGIVAVDDGGTWAGATNLELPFG
jgi:hypothetical protein